MTVSLRRHPPRPDSQITADPPPVFSLVVELPPIDPLVALGKLITSYPRYFFWHRGERSVLALGHALEWSSAGLESLGDDLGASTAGEAGRFAAAQAFLERVYQSPAELGGVPPIVYGYFPFFAHPSPATQPFPHSYLCLPKWQIERRGQRSFLLAHAVTAVERSRLGAELGAMQARLATLAHLTPSRTNSLAAPPWVVAPPTPMTGAIDQALGDIKDGTLEKIVLAQTQDLIAPQPLSITRSLANLRHQYPDCYTFALGDGAGHGFLGASPERLLAIHRGQLTCDALAGSAARGEDVVADRALATALLADPKEQREHSLVREFIIQRLQKLHLQPQWPDRSQLLQLKNIQHIWTPITAPVSAQLSPLEILAQLHPTPAVAGLPQALACEKIQAYEPIDRGLYAAPVGWVDGVGNSEWIVGIRSALVQGAQARLYAGAGLVAGSDAGQELAEIQLKFQPLYRALSV